MTTEHAPAPRFVPSPVRLGYIGCGFMAQNVHLPNFSSIAGCELVALAERRPRLREKVADKYRIARRYPSHAELANDSTIDAVAVSAAYAEQGEIAADLLRAGKHVFVEKPMAVSERQAARILEAAKLGGARLMVAYMKRYDAGNLLMQEIAARWRQDGTAGGMLFARNHGFCGDWLVGLEPNQMIKTDEPLEEVLPANQYPDWLPDARIRSYVSYLQQYTHNINLLRFLLGAQKTEQVGVEVVTFDSDGFTGIVVLKLAGVRCVIESATSNYHTWDEHTQLYFTNGWLRAVAPPFFSRSSCSSVEVYQRLPWAEFRYPNPGGIGTWPYWEEAKHFIESLRSGAPFRSSGEDALLDVILNEEIYKTYLATQH